jgi:hypothetical protein
MHSLRRSFASCSRASFAIYLALSLSSVACAMTVDGSHDPGSASGSAEATVSVGPGQIKPMMYDGDDCFNYCFRDLTWDFCQKACYGRLPTN